MVEPMATAAASNKPKQPVVSESTDAFSFNNLQQEGNLYKFCLAPIHVSYANTLRRIILTGIKTIAFRSDMISTGKYAGTTTDVSVLHNDTPMTNEMLADRIGLLPIHIPNPLEWNNDKYEFVLHVKGSKDHVIPVTASDFKMVEITNPEAEDEPLEKNEVDAAMVKTLFPEHAITKETPLIALLQPSDPPQQIHIIAKTSIGTGREHARFSPVSQCSYEYSLDTNPERQEKMLTDWLAVAKKITMIDKATEDYARFKREFETMQIKRCYLKNTKEEPYSFDFTLESVGPLTIDYIVDKACEEVQLSVTDEALDYIVDKACEEGAQKCIAYSTIDKMDIPSVHISLADNRIIGFDFLFQNEDHTLGNLLQTWLVENHIDGKASPRITYAGYSVPHPLRDEMIIRIGVEEKDEKIARQAIAAAARGCAEMFHKLRTAWNTAPKWKNASQRHNAFSAKTPINVIRRNTSD